MHNSLRETTEQILASYQRAGGINNIDGLNLPSKRAVGSICEDLLQVLFPGFHDQEPVHSSDLQRVTAYRIQSIGERLKIEICKSMRIDDSGCPEDAAEKVLLKFLQALPEARELLQTDVEAAYEGDPASMSFEEIIVAYPFIEAIAIQRLAHVLYRLNLPILPRIMTEWAHCRTGIDIHPGAQIGSHFFIDHGTGVVIGETSRIGSHVKLYHGVTLGAKSFERDSNGKILKGGKRHPNVEDGVTIYPGSTVLGGETTIGARTTIGGNVFLMQSIPPDSLVSYEETQLQILSKHDRNATLDDSK